VNFAGIAGFNATLSPGGNVNLQYLDVNGAVLAVPTAGAVNYVRVGIAGYSIPLFIPGLNVTITSPTFTATLPSESMGLVVSGTNVVSTPC
jgi:hypothetical protein